MRCASVKICLALAFLLCPGPDLTEARDYTPIERKIPLPKFIQQGKAPAQAPKPRASQTRTPPATHKAPQPAPAAPRAESAAQAESAPQTGNGGRPNLFGTVEFGRPLNSLPGWLDVLDRNRRDPVFELKKRLIRNVTWGELRQQTESLDTLEKLRKVNTYWNQNPYREDQEVWGKPDYWAIPAQFIDKSGDCEDYAIAKYFTLKELGIDPASMRIVVLRDNIRNLAHAVLAVYYNNDIYILDNVTNIVLSHKRIRNYQPQFSVNELGRWTHIKGKPAK